MNPLHMATLAWLMAFPAAADVGFVAILSVSEANTAAFDALAEKMVAASSEDEGLLIYEFARVGETVYGYERYTDEEAHRRHQSLIKPFLPELFELAEFEAIVTLTPVSDELRPELEAIGAAVGNPIAGVAQGSLE